MRTLVLLSLLVCGCAGRQAHPFGFVLDSEHDLTPAQVQRLDSLFRAHEQHTGNEVVLVTSATLGDTTARVFAVAFGDSLGVGKPSRHNGVVIACSQARRNVFIATGRGTERVLTDSICQRIADSTMIPPFKRGALFDGLWAGSLEIVRFLDQPENRIH